MASSPPQISSAIFLRLTFLIAYTSNILWSCYGHSAGQGFGFRAPLIHWSSPQSPYYKPNAKPVELMQESIRASRARAKYIQSIRSGSRKFAAPPVLMIDRHYVMLYSVGTPPVDTYAIPDTGSNINWLQCGPVCNCYNQRIPWFDPSKSTTYSSKNCSSLECKLGLWGQYHRCKYPSQTCSYSVSYEDGSHSEGVIGTDTFTFVNNYLTFENNYTMLGAIFGCGYNNSGITGEDPETINAPGIIGLGRQTPSLVSQLDPGQFSYCISTDSEKLANGTFSIRFGSGARVPRHTTKLVSNEFGWYIFGAVDGIYVGGEKVTGYPDWVFEYKEGGHGGGLMMDTGAGYSYFQHDVFGSLIKTLKHKIAADYDLDISGSGYSLCYGLEDFFFVDIPDMEIRFKDNKATIYPLTLVNSWINNGHSQVCLAMLESYQPMSVIGMRHQRDIRIGYDLRNNLASFFESSECNDSES